MRTRSKARADAAIDKKKKNTEKRKRKDDVSALGDTGDRSKRCKIQSYGEVTIASQVKSPLKKKYRSSADPETALVASKNAENEVTFEKFVGALQKRGAADRSSPNATGATSCASLKKAIAKKHGTKESLIQPGQSCDHTHILDDHHGRDNEKSTEGVAIEQCSSRNISLGKRLHMKNSLLFCADAVQHHEENASTWQGGIDWQEDLTPTHYDEDRLQIVCTPLSPQEPQEHSHHNEPDAILSQGKTKKLSLPLPCRRSGRSKCHPGNFKRFNNQRKESVGLTLTEVSQPSNSCYSHKRLNDAKSRWKNLSRSILSAKISPEILASASEDLVKRQIFSDVGASNQAYKTRSLPKKQRKPFTAANALAADQRSATGRMQQKVHKKQLSLLKRMKTWLTEAKFSQSAKEGNSNDVGEEFIMTEVERYAFVQTMVKSCQKNRNMRTVFLESVRMLTLSGLMQVAASKVLQQGPCEEAQNVMNAWEDFKEQSAITKTLPLNLLNAVNQLHEKRGDLTTKLSMPNSTGICTVSQIDEQTWKFQLPG